MSVAEVLLVLSGGGTVIGAVFSGLRAWRSDKTTAAERSNTNLMAGYGELMEELRADMKRLREEQEAERQAWADERQAWVHEREELCAEIARLRDRVQELEKRTPPHGTPTTNA